METVPIYNVNNGGSLSSWFRPLLASLFPTAGQQVADSQHPPQPFDVAWKGPILVAFDFGHHGSGISFSMDGGASVELFTAYPDQLVPYAKTSTCLLYNRARRAVAWGCTAERRFLNLSQEQRQGYTLVKGFKLALHTEPGMQPQALEGAEWLDPVDATADYLRFMCQ